MLLRKIGFFPFLQQPTHATSKYILAPMLLFRSLLFSFILFSSLLFSSVLFSLLYSILLFCPIPSCSFYLFFLLFFPCCLSFIVIFSRASIIDQRSLLSLTYSVNSPPLMEPGGLLPSLQELVTGTPLGDADETIANFHTLFLSNQL